MADGSYDSVVDKGYAWVVLFGVALCTFLEMGNFKIFGLYFVSFLEEFKSSASVTSMIIAIYSICYSFAALIVDAYITEKFSCRQIMIVGGIVAAMALVFSSLANSIEIIIFTNGFMSAIGSACLHGPSMIILGKYFHRRRGMSNSIALAMGSAGGLLQPVLYTSLLAVLGLRGALLIQAGLVSNCILAGCLSRPIALSQTYAQFHSKKKLSNSKQEIATALAQERLLDEVDENDIKNSQFRNVFSKNGEFDSSNGTLHNSSTSIAEYSSMLDLRGPSLADVCQISEGEKETENLQPKSCLPSIDLSILKNKLIMLFTAVFCSTNITCVLAQIFIPPLARDRGIAESSLGIVVSAIGTAEFAGRIILAFISDRQCIERYRILMCAVVANGLMLQFTRLLHNFVDFLVFGISYGLFSGAMHSLYTSICIDFIGLEKFHKALGLLHLSQGLLSGIVNVFIGLLRDVTGGYEVGFHIMGGFGLLAGGLILLVPKFRKKESTPP